MLSGIPKIAFIVTVLFGSSWSFDFAYADCSQVLALTGRNLMKSVQENDQKAFFYNNICKASGSSIGLEFGNLQSSFGFNYGSKEQFCQEQASKYDNYGFSSLETSNVVEKALSVFLDCRRLEKEKISISVGVAADKVTFDLGRSGNTTGILYGWKAAEGVTCALISTKKDRERAVEQRNLNYALPIAEKVQISCERTPVPSSTSGSQYYPSVDIVVFTSEGSLTAPIPADARVSETWASQILEKVTSYDTRITEYKGQIADLNNKIAVLQAGKVSDVTLIKDEHGTFQNGWLDCPPGWVMRAVQMYPGQPMQQISCQQLSVGKQ
ncbi:hypothetical protein EN833_15120 [Mesorhizobium sp. M4B.F.Ca.ET.190.01.1.1]|uniref:hypothetical protein n=1 Tax=unclassified Mesorhizobium TaxID=325217 RepID=UPI001092D2F5|nr:MULTISPECIES: hypothetical protein [unclassified Mesorhizobium]TGR08792.1 hypothetical protein EN843_15115 [Mesorhizobium sp. M4B.F.Ca.ET.200.01.1.1]TGS18269.1 hypothetical protein EN833_15120 [Mesorhizobium sp. M4B.F.Ca.ET.190.01.1.1]TGT30082.1 hypothetical protein EN815_15100 [Mesorhizobium sp. M4B.F.Ca.ET.172.01.1.1]